MKPKNPLMTPAQRRHLEARLVKERSRRTSAIRHAEGLDKDPPDVARARAIVTRHDRRKHAKWQSAYDSVWDRYNKVKGDILFGTPEQAMANVKAFEESK